MDESLRCSPETLTTLLIGNSPTQNVFGVKNNNNNNKSPQTLPRVPYKIFLWKLTSDPSQEAIHPSFSLGKFIYSTSLQNSLMASQKF